MSHRPAFESRSDVRTFLALLAWKVHEGQIEVHAYSILTTHFHLLLRSPRGELSDAMMWIENRYVKRFNRLRGRDGSLFKSRFRSRIVDDEEYWFNVIRYIDANPVDAGLCSTAAEYPYGSAMLYCGAQRPRWLETAIVEDTVRRLSRCSDCRPEDYARLFGVALDSDERWVLERRIESGAANVHGAERSNELLRAAPAHVLEWLRTRARLADGGTLGLVLASPAQVACQVRRLAVEDPTWSFAPGRRVDSPWRTIEIGLLRQLCGLSIREIAIREKRSTTCAWAHCQRHDEWLRVEPEYARRVERVIRAVQVRPAWSLGGSRGGVSAVCSG
jgi:REP element-mobilizing transposase RayT